MSSSRGCSQPRPRDPSLPGSARLQRSPRRGPELSTGAPHRPDHRSPGRQLPAQKLREEPLPRMLGALSAETPGEETRRGGQEEAPVPRGAQPLLTGAPSLPGRTPCLLSLPARGDLILCHPLLLLPPILPSTHTHAPVSALTHVCTCIQPQHPHTHAQLTLSRACTLTTPLTPTCTRAQSLAHSHINALVHTCTRM